MLDDYYEAVVGDFGLAKLLDHADSHVTTAVRGTVGHIAPEYLSTGQSSEKTDVFGFGILLLELVTGMRAFEFGKTANQKGNMLEWVRFSLHLTMLNFFVAACQAWFPPMFPGMHINMVVWASYYCIMIFG